MPSFFESLRRIVAGQPVFNPADLKEQKPQALRPVSQYSSGTLIGADGRKIIPEVVIGNVECRPNGANLLVECIISNGSSEPIELDKLTILGAVHELDNFLRAGEERRFIVYDGSKPLSSTYNKAELYYKNHGGDYFCAQHLVEFDQLADKSYSIHRIRFLPPIHDV